MISSLLLDHSNPWDKKEATRIRNKAFRKIRCKQFPPRKNSIPYELRKAFPVYEGWVRIHVQLGWKVPEHILRMHLQKNNEYAKLLARDLLTWPQSEALPRNPDNSNLIQD